MVQQAGQAEEEAEAEEAFYDDGEPAARFDRTHQEEDGPDPDRYTNIWQEYCNGKDYYSDFDLLYVGNTVVMETASAPLLS